MRAKKYIPVSTPAGQETGVHQKGWGWEVWIVNNELYCGKILHFNRGKMCSLHYHMNKHETMYLQSGHLKIRFIDTEKGEEYFEELFPGDSIVISPRMIHQIGAIEESELFEFSTEHWDSDSYRIEKGD